MHYYRYYLNRNQYKNIHRYDTIFMQNLYEVLELSKMLSSTLWGLLPFSNQGNLRGHHTILLGQSLLNTFFLKLLKLRLRPWSLQREYESEAYSEPCEIFKVEHFAKIVNGCQSLYLFL